jgi:hypothetical protein
MASVNHTRPHCVNQMGKTHSKPLASRYGRGTAWARHAMCESAFMGTKRQGSQSLFSGCFPGGEHTVSGFWKLRNAKF